jgi:hypothetical protein
MPGWFGAFSGVAGDGLPDFEFYMEDDKHIQVRQRLEVINTIILAVATLAITWCSYQSTLWSGVQLFKLAESSRFFGRSQQQTLLVAQRQQIDADVAINFMSAVIDNKQDHIDYYLKRGKAEVSAVLSEWLAQQPLKNEHSPVHPLAMPQYQKLTKQWLAKADADIATGQQLWAEAEKANNHGDNYVLLNVIFSMTMFLGAIATKMVRLKLVRTVLIIAGVICAAALMLLLFVMPVTWQ